MRANRRVRPRAIAAFAATAVLGLVAFGPAGTARAAAPPVTINGAGSSYAYPALNQWATDEQSHGLSINYNPNGSAQGRQQYAANQMDYAGTDIAYITQSEADPFAGSDSAPQYAYSYIPDVAGGLSFLYNIQVAGHKITNMRLSGRTLAQIFTGQITNWNDSRITHDYGGQLPSIPITVVTRSDGAGESYFLTRWMLHQYPSIWVPYCQARGGGSLCTKNATESYPSKGEAGFKSIYGANNVTGYVGSPTNNGAIGYAEYYYPLHDNLPVVKMLNAAGYYVGPSASNVAIALQHAQIDPNPSSVTFLMQNLDYVYGNTDPRTYPLSSYSYLIVPRDTRPSTPGPPPTFSAGKATTLSTYVGYMLCQAQASAQSQGYSPLPGVMVNGGFSQYNHIPNHVYNSAGNGQYNQCNNPAYTNGIDTITRDAPYPNACQKVGSPNPCRLGSNGQPLAANGPGGSGPGGSGPGGSGPGGTGPGGTGATSCPSTPPPTSSKSPHSTPSPTSTCIPGAGSGGSINPNTGQLVNGTQGPAANLAAAPVAGIGGSPAEQWMFGILAAILLLLAVAVPAGLGTWLAEAGGRRQRPWGGLPPGPGGRPPASGPVPSAPPPDGQRPPEQPGTGPDA